MTVARRAFGVKHRLLLAFGWLFSEQQQKRNRRGWGKEKQKLDFYIVGFWSRFY